MVLSSFFVFIASLLGGSHCLIMCGPASLLVPRQWHWVGLYHVTRLIVYLSLGALVYRWGHYFLGNMITPFRQWGTAAIVSLVFSVFIFTQFRKKKSRYLRERIQGGLERQNRTSNDSVSVSRSSSVQHTCGLKSLKLLKNLQRWPSAMRSIALGLLTALIPCGWLYLFLMNSFMSQNVVVGMSHMFFFWLGTLPHLVGLQWFFRQQYPNFFSNRRWVAVGFLAVAIMTSVHYRFFKAHFPDPDQPFDLQVCSLPSGF